MAAWKSSSSAAMRAKAESNCGTSTRSPPRGDGRNGCPMAARQASSTTGTTRWWRATRTAALSCSWASSAQTWHIWQTSRNGGWTPQWTQHPAPPGHLATGFGTLILRPDGRVQLFAIGVISAQSNALLHIMQTAPSQRLDELGVAGRARGRRWIEQARGSAERRRAPRSLRRRWGRRSMAHLADQCQRRLVVLGVARRTARNPSRRTAAGGHRAQLPGAPRTVGPRRGQGAVAYLAGSPQRRLVELGLPRHSAGHHFTFSGPAMAAAPTDAWNCSSAATTTRCGTPGRSPRAAAGHRGRPTVVPRPPTRRFPAACGTHRLGAELRRSLELFVAGTNTELWHIWQTGPNQGWSGWLSHGSPPGFKIFGP